MLHVTTVPRRYDTGPTIAVAAGDGAAAWNNGRWSGDPALIAVARVLVDTNTTVHVRGIPVTCDPTPRGVLAALWQYAPGRTIVTEAPPDVIEELFGTAHPEPDPERPRQE